jgi:hypothetical protein
MTKLSMTNKSTSSAGHFDGYGGAPEQYRWHRPMQHVQSYFGSPWTLPSGNYLLRIALAAARATGKQTTRINKYTYRAGRFDGHGDAPARNRMQRPMEEVQSLIRSNWMPPLGKYCGR